MYADFDQKEKARTSIPKVANFLQLGLRLILMKYKGWFDEFDSNVCGPSVPQVEFFNMAHKICQKI